MLSVFFCRHRVSLIAMMLLFSRIHASHHARAPRFPFTTKINFRYVRNDTDSYPYVCTAAAVKCCVQLLGLAVLCAQTFSSQPPLAPDPRSYRFRRAHVAGEVLDWHSPPRTCQCCTATVCAKHSGHAEVRKITKNGRKEKKRKG